MDANNTLDAAECWRLIFRSAPGTKVGDIGRDDLVAFESALWNARPAGWRS